MNKLMQLANRIEFSNIKNSSKFNSFLKITKKFIAFTLAETLIVMGVIGIVAALTIPNLNSSTGNKEKVTRVKKIYAQLSEAHDRATAVYGPVENWFTNLGCTNFGEYDACSLKYFDRISEFMKMSKICRTEDNNCFITGWIPALSESASSTQDIQGYPSAVLADGTSISIKANSSGDGCATSYVTANEQCGEIVVDIDGPNKGKNTEGIDIFHFYFTRDGIKPHRTDSLSWESIDCFFYGVYCAVWVLENDNMDYLLTKDKSTKEKAAICPNNNTLSWETIPWTVTSCK